MNILLKDNKMDYEVRFDHLGTKRWFFKRKLHREGGPAVEAISGHKEWYLNGKRHREDGPAIEYANGDKYWYINGRSHREDGPAVEFADGDRYWYLNGEPLTREAWLEMLPEELKVKALFSEHFIKG